MLLLCGWHKALISFAVVLLPSTSTMLRQSSSARHTDAAAHGIATSSNGSQLPMLRRGDEQQQNPNYFDGGMEWGTQQQQPLQAFGALQTVDSSEPGVYYMPVQATVLQPFIVPPALPSMVGAEGASGLSPGYVTCEWPPCGDQGPLTTPSPVRPFAGAPIATSPSFLEPQVHTLTPFSEVPLEVDTDAITGLLRELDTSDTTPEQALSDMLMRSDASADAYPRLVSFLISAADSGCGIACVWHKLLQKLGIEKKKKQEAEVSSSGSTSLLCPNISGNSSTSACSGNTTTDDVHTDNNTTYTVTTDNVTADNVTTDDLPKNTVFVSPENTTVTNSTTADCDVCASTFSVDGGCEAMKNGDDLAPFIPPGCGACGDEAAALCIPVAEVDNTTNESVLDNTSFYAHLSTLADALSKIYPERAEATIDAEMRWDDSGTG